MGFIWVCHDEQCLGYHGFRQVDFVAWNELINKVLVHNHSQSSVLSCLFWVHQTCRNCCNPCFQVNEDDQCISSLSFLKSKFWNALWCFRNMVGIDFSSWGFFKVMHAIVDLTYVTNQTWAEILFWGPNRFCI